MASSVEDRPGRRLLAFAYSLQFNVNTGGGIPELPRDAFWKLGSGGHALYVVPSLDLVVWKLGGRDDQDSPANTRMEPIRMRCVTPRCARTGKPASMPTRQHGARWSS
jgi:CubicO group peptidase (beta-lactamase class C family)